MARVIIYTRFSPRPDSDTSDSLETQEQQCREYCEAKGHEVIATFGDAGKSGADMERVGLWTAIEALDKGAVLVALNMQRVARSVMLEEVILRAIRYKKATIEVVHGGIIGSEPEDVMLRQILAAFSEFERAVISKRTKYAMRLHVRNGRKMSSKPPYGWDLNPDYTVADKAAGLPHMLVRNEDEWDTIEQVGIWRAEGLSFAAICAALTDAGTPTKFGGVWFPMQVRRMAQRVLEGDVRMPDSDALTPQDKGE